MIFYIFSKKVVNLLKQYKKNIEEYNYSLFYNQFMGMIIVTL
ncbi:hypothetical protein TGUWTKB_0730 [Candidatus Tachikawaea gelatinosa]|uniref:Uncharacterized protein n=1 Tax=Candidatus Tachikawaea gelatinosa TaxID=1410383 RepID=A0A090APW8_9ENTR|nr:hypothetical protein TGUWTKB_0730 [Candidatus Tachikawaea gelatinosa]